MLQGKALGLAAAGALALSAAALWYGDRAGYARAVGEQAAVMAEAFRANDEAAARRRDADIQRAAADATAATRRDIQHHTAMREIHRENDDCADRALPADSHRVLNIARTGADQLPQAPGTPAGEAYTFATNRDERAAHAQCATAYRDCSAQLASLIQWHQQQDMSNE